MSAENGEEQTHDEYMDHPCRQCYEEADRLEAELKAANQKLAVARVALNKLSEISIARGRGCPECGASINQGEHFNCRTYEALSKIKEDQS